METIDHSVFSYSKCSTHGALSICMIYVFDDIDRVHTNTYIHFSVRMYESMQSNIKYYKIYYGIYIYRELIFAACCGTASGHGVL
jgi:hypothetical protein